ncbi:MAG: chromosomal replication initiator protein DnaA [Deltaproteobacteria bacterium]|nr:chromosomal replication initiator protein DnaA [Deltaproteobacteria bacterium]
MNSLDWTATVNSIKEDLPLAQFQNWVKPIEYLRSDDKIIHLGVPSRFHEDMVRSRFVDTLKKAIRRQTGNDLQLEFQVLIRDENTEAAKSEVPDLEIPKPQTPSPAQGRPVLRLIESETSFDDDEISTAESLYAPNYPKFNTPFLSSGFNQLAYQCAMLFAEGSNTQVNPLIIQSAVGMGKTHLLSEIGEAIHRRQPHLRIRYTTFEAFTSEMVKSFNDKTASEFQRRYRLETDLLLFDDVAGLAGRKRSQEELLHIFNEILARGGRIAFSTSTPISRLTEFIDPLKSRLASGLSIDIKSPNFEEKVELLGQVSFHSQISVDPTVLRSIADKGQKDVRELIGSLFRVHLQAQLENKPLNNEFLAKEGWIQESQKEVITLDEIIGLVEHNFGVTRADMVSKSRKQAIVWARQVAMYLARRYTLLPLEEIGKTFGRDHATVIHAFDKVSETMQFQPTQGYQVEFLIKKLEARQPKDNYELPL